MWDHRVGYWWKGVTGQQNSCKILIGVHEMHTCPIVTTYIIFSRQLSVFDSIQQQLLLQLFIARTVDKENPVDFAVQYYRFHVSQCWCTCVAIATCYCLIMIATAFFSTKLNQVNLQHRIQILLLMHNRVTKVIIKALQKYMNMPLFQYSLQTWLMDYVVTSIKLRSLG